MKSVYDKIKAFKELIKVIISESITDTELRLCIDHITRYKDKSRKYLTDREHLINDVILRNGYNPKTLLSWFKVLQLPRFLQQQIKEDKITCKKARRLYKDYRIKTNEHIQQEIIEDIRGYFNSMRFEEFIDETLENGKRNF